MTLLRTQWSSSAVSQGGKIGVSTSDIETVQTVIQDALHTH